MGFFEKLPVFLFLNMIFLGISASQVDKPTNKRGYKLYRLTPMTEEQMRLLDSLDEHEEEFGLEFWLHRAELGAAVDVAVEPQRVDIFESFLNKHEIPFEILISDLQRALNQERRQRSLLSHLRRGNFKSGSLDLTKFYQYDEIISYIKQIAAKHNDTVRLYAAGKSFEGRDIPVLIITNGDWDMNKPMLVVDAGIHAREWIAPAEALYITNQLVEKSKQNQDVLKNLNWVVIPIVNPDGYIYSHSKNRLWRKTRKPSGRNCVGTDANRNYAYKWGGKGASKDPCSDTFRGAEAFSEKESSAVRDVLKKFLPQVKMYLSLHAYGPFILYPWGYAKELPENWEDIEKMARIGADSIKAATGRQYKVGSSAKLLYNAAGGSDDYALSLGIPYAFTMELPRGGITGFNPPPTAIQSMVTETWVGIKAMAKALSEEFETIE